MMKLTAVLNKIKKLEKNNKKNSALCRKFFNTPEKAYKYVCTLM